MFTPTDCYIHATSHHCTEQKLSKLGPVMRILLALGLILILPATAVSAPPGLIVLKTPHNFSELEKRVPVAIKKHGMLRVFTASASKAAKKRGITIPGDRVYGVYRNDFAVRMIEANALAGTEAPILVHLMEQADGTASLAYKTPSSVFAPYGGPDELKALAKELDAIFEAIVKDAAAP